MSLNYKSCRQQQGFLLPLALFIIVVLGSMSLVVSKKVAQSSSSYVLNGISVQTFYAAESGAQAGLHELFFLDTDRQLVDGRCEAMAISRTLNVDGLKNCTVTVACACHYENGDVCDQTDSTHYLGISGISHSFYTIDSAAQCGVAPMLAKHKIEVGASL
jgi:MSHA biogenesis protein MshP